MIHQPWGGARGTAEDIHIQAREIKTLKKALVDILARHTGKPPEKIEADSDRDYFMSGYEAREYGLVDEVIEPAALPGGDAGKKK
jgi:ATP-dependent Clp protease protease subunit